VRSLDEGSGMQVSVITASAATTTVGGMQAFEPAAQVQFDTEARSLAAAALWPRRTEPRGRGPTLGPRGAVVLGRGATGRREPKHAFRMRAPAATQRTGQDQTAAPAEASLQSVDRSATAANAAQTAKRRRFRGGGRGSRRAGRRDGARDPVDLDARAGGTARGAAEPERARR
jgi:hypothetical protein